MQAAQRTALTKALSGHVSAIAADLRKQMLEPGRVRDRAKQLHTDEQVADDFDFWTDLLSRRAAVLWVLKTVYVRVLEDRGLLRPARLLDPEAQQLFEKLAPSLGETAFLSWVFRDLASPRGGLPELFAVQPAEVGVPADAFSRALLAFWRSKDADTGFQWSFANEAFAGELMGDLYQYLDPIVRSRYALCQTPDFVRDLILEETLTPAIAEMGADQVRVLDPSCGSGHFLLDALTRLVDAIALQHVDWPRRKVVEHALDSVVGIDLNDYACSMARARLVMTAAELAGVPSLAESGGFHPNVYWADGLEQVELNDDNPHVQLDLLSGGSIPTPRAVLTRPSVRIVLRPILKKRFDVIVGNPPYIAESDEAKKAYHREKVNGRKRYISAHGDYSLASPFVERCLHLSKPGAWIGLIVGDTFMKRDFGKPLIEKVLAVSDLHLVVDATHVSIPHHGTPTVLLFFRAREPGDEPVRVAIGKKGDDTATVRQVWDAIVVATDWDAARDSEFASSLRVSHEDLAKHPWLFERQESGGPLQALTTMGRPLSQLVGEIGRAVVCGEDDAYVFAENVAKRLGIATACRRVVAGDAVRDWAVASKDVVLYPYETLGGEQPISVDSGAVARHFWRYRTLLRGRTVFGKTPAERGEPWFGYLEHYRQRLKPRVVIAHAFIASGNHFALPEPGSVATRSAPLVVPADPIGSQELQALIAYLNSSVVSYLMKSAGRSQSHAGQKHHPDPERATHQFSVAKVEAIRVPDLDRWTAELAELGLIAETATRQRKSALSLSYWVHIQRGHSCRVLNALHVLAV